MISAEQARANKPKQQILAVLKKKPDSYPILEDLSARILAASYTGEEVFFDHHDKKIFKEVVEVLKGKKYSIEETGLKWTVKIVWEKEK